MTTQRRASCPVSSPEQESRFSSTDYPSPELQKAAAAAWISTVPPVLGFTNMKRYQKSERLFSRIIAVAILAAVPVGNPAVAADQASPSLVEATDQVQIRKTITNGFVHPGIGLTKEILENVRTQVLAKQEPWLSGFRALASDRDSARNVSCRNQSRKDPSKPDADAFDSRRINDRLMVDSFKAYRQVVMYYLTGDEVYRANAMNIVRVWSQMDRTRYKRWPEDHIHSSYPIQRMIIAAELLRYTSFRDPKLAWTEQDTDSFTNNFVVPTVSTFLNQNGWFMNQNGYPIAAAMSGDIFTSDRKSYERRVEWFTVNKDAPNKGWSFSIKDLARLVTTNALTGEQVDRPRVQLMEMGRDQAHAGDDMEIFNNVVRMMHAQGTKVDPVTGVISTAHNAVDPYEFLDNRILAAADYFSRFMLGYDTPWIPVAYDIEPNGKVRGIYPRIADNYRGRIREHEFWGPFYYYTYKKGIDVARKAPYYYEAFTKRIVSSDVEWLFIPKEATGEGAKVPPTEQEPDVVEVKRRSTLFDKNASVVEENHTSFVRVKPTPSGTRIAILSADTDRKAIWLRIRTTGVAEIEMSRFEKPWLLPDTKGELRQVPYTMSNLEHFGDIVYFLVKGSPKTQVDLESLFRKADPELTAPEYNISQGDVNVVAYVGAPVRLDLSAKGEGIRISSLDQPPDAVLNGETGVFQWQPKQVGEYEFVVMATEREIVVPKKVSISVTADRQTAIEKITKAHAPADAYVEASFKRYKALCDDTVHAMDHVNDQEFFAKLMQLQVAFSKLEPLTPRLPDGSMDFPKVVVSSNIGAKIALLTDGNDDTFPVYTLAKDLNYIFDFGDSFRFSASAFAIEGRLNFENRASDTAFFGSNDGNTWTQLTSEITKLPTELTQVKVYQEHLGAKFRYLKIQKLSRNSGGLFEPSELRIYGQRYEAR